MNPRKFSNTCAAKICVAPDGITEDGKLVGRNEPVAGKATNVCPALPQVAQPYFATTKAMSTIETLPFGPVDPKRLTYCQENHVTVMAYTPLADGSLAAKTRFRRHQSFEALESVAAQVNKTPAQVALNWCTSHANVIAIPKSNSLSRTEENCGASGWRLSQEQVQFLDQAFDS